MNKFEKILAMLFITTLVAGCSVYKARDEGLSRVGYEEQRLEDGSYQLTYYGATSDSHEDVEKLWHRRANELCQSEHYDASTEKDHWVFDAYTVLPPLVFKNKAAGPVIEGRLHCKV